MRGWVDSFILPHGNNLTGTKSTFQKDMRFEVPHAFLDETMSCLREYVQGIKAELMFNLDEVRMWE
jgi:hypothetical protein